MWVGRKYLRKNPKLSDVGRMTSRDLVHCILTILIALQCSFENCYDSKF